jgi:hypothetical protein
MRSLAVGFTDGLIESVFQQDTVGQTRQGIVQRQLRSSRFASASDEARRAVRA